MRDALLTWRFKRGGGDALRRIYEKYKGDLLKLAVALSRDPSIAEDVVHDVFVSFAQAAERLKVSGNLKSYLATSVVNRIRNRNRALRRHGTVGLDEVDPPASDGESPADWIICSEELRRLNGALHRLPYPQREVIVLHLHGGMKFREIAALQSDSINTIKSRYRYGLDKLRSILNGEVRSCDQ